MLDAARRLAGHGSVVVIAPSLDTITSADQILVLDRGRLVQHGTHAELHRTPGLYRDLIAGSPATSSESDR